MRCRATPGAILMTLTVCLALQSWPRLVWGKAGWVEVRVTDHRAGIADFTALWIELAEVTLHRGDRPRGQGWVPVMQDAPAVDIVPLKQGRSTLLGQMPVEAARYDAVRVRFGDARGELQQGTAAHVVPMHATVAVDIVVEPGTIEVILIDMYVEDQNDHQPGRYAVKIWEIRVKNH